MNEFSVRRVYRLDSSNRSSTYKTVPAAVARASEGRRTTRVVSVRTAPKDRRPRYYNT